MDEALTQTIFVKDGSAKVVDKKLNPRKLRALEESRAELDRRARLMAVCPWCLYRGSLKEFTRIGEDGKVAKTVECPDCKQGMKIETTRLVEELGPWGYSQWLWENVYMWHNYEKVRWEPLKARARGMGFISTFWAVRDVMKRRRESPIQATRGDDFERSVQEYYKEKKGLDKALEGC